MVFEGDSIATSRYDRMGPGVKEEYKSGDTRSLQDLKGCMFLASR